MLSRSSWRNSIGSSIVTMWHCRVCVDVPDHRGERGRLAGAGRTGAEHEPAGLVGEPSHALRQAELDEVRDVARDHAEREGDRPALAEAVDAEPGKATRRVGEVELACLLEPPAAGGVVRGDGVENRCSVGFRRAAAIRGAGRASVVAEDRRLVDLQVHVAGVRLDCTLQQGLEIHPSVIGTARKCFRQPERRPAARARRSPSTAGAPDRAPLPAR